MTTNNKKVTMSNKGNIEYKMSKTLADFYLKLRKGTEKNKNPQEYLCQIVNNEFDINGICTKVLID